MAAHENLDAVRNTSSEGREDEAGNWACRDEKRNRQGEEPQALDEGVDGQPFASEAVVLRDDRSRVAEERRDDGGEGSCKGSGRQDGAEGRVGRVREAKRANRRINGRCH